MNLEGELRVNVAWDGARVRDVRVHSTRARVIGRLVQGRSPDSTVELIARLHAVCSGAQGAVAANACDVARSGEIDTEIASGREQVVKLEAMQEHCTRLGLDWAAAMDDTPLVPMVRSVRAVLSPLLSGIRVNRTDFLVPSAAQAQAAIDTVALLVSHHLLGASPHAWLELEDLTDVTAWAERATIPPARWWRRLTRDAPRLGTSTVAVMPLTSADALQTFIAPRLRASDGFTDSPDWDGSAVETGPLARMRAHPLIASALTTYGNSVATRLLARLTELAALLAGAETEAGRPRAFGVPGDGFASAHTARGLLVHRAVVHDDVIADYVIVAPTEWNFHAQGAFAAAMQGLVASDERSLRRDASLITRSLDPCVACTVEVAHA